LETSVTLRLQRAFPEERAS